MIRSETHEAFLQNVRLKLRESHTNQRVFAERLGISEARCSEIINGRFEPKLSLIERVAKALDCEAFELLVPAGEKIPA